MLAFLLSSLEILLYYLRPAIFVVGALAAIAALVSYSVRTRRIGPFTPIARFTRERIDPWLIAPVERHLLRAGGTPHSAPWWALAAVVVGGLALIAVLQFVHDQLYLLMAYSASGAGGLLRILLAWTFGLLKIALLVRVIASWVGGSAYSKWWRWAFVLTEPILAPLRRIIPTIGMFDVTVIVAYFALGFLEDFVMRGL